MLVGEAVVAIWNGIAPEGREDFYAWHVEEHIPERVAILGFRRGRRYIAANAATSPEFFTLYEAGTMQVLQGSDYAERLAAPTPWTRRATAHFRDTSRALARVVETSGPGPGGAVLTIRFSAPDVDKLTGLIRAARQRPRVCGAHLCVADPAASGVRTAESEGRTDIGAPPNAFAMLEATDPGAFATLLTDAELREAGASEIVRGVYRLEYARLKAA